MSNNLEIKYSYTTKDNVQIICCNYKYYFNAKNISSVRYRCLIDKCNASLTVDNDNNVIKINGKKCPVDADYDTIQLSHNGHAQISEIDLAIGDALLVINDLKKKIFLYNKYFMKKKANLCVLINILIKFLNYFHNFMKNRVKNYAAKKTFFPPVPDTLSDLNIEGDWCNAESGQQFLIFM